MTTESTVEMRNDQKLSRQIGVDGKVQLLWKVGDGKKQLFPQVTEDGKVQSVHRSDHDAIEAGKLAAAQNELKFIVIVMGFKVVFSVGAFYHLVIYSKKANRDYYFFTIVENIHLPLVLLFIPLTTSTKESLEIGNEGILSLQTHSGDGKVQFVDPNEEYAVDSAKLAAREHEVEFEVIKFGFNVKFSTGPYYHLVFSGKDNTGVSKSFFTVVEAQRIIPIYKPVVLVFTPLKLSTLQMGNCGDDLSLQMGGGDGKLQYVNPNDDKAIEAAKLAAAHNGVEFTALALGFKIIFPGAEFYQLLILTKEGDSKSELFFTVVAYSIYQPVVLLFKPVEFPVD